MKDRPPSSYGFVYVPPDHRLYSAITTSNYTSPVSIASKLQEKQTYVAAAALNRMSSTYGVLAYYQTSSADYCLRRQRFR
ncbi:hypothetical protein COP1_031181 [Malus domestica]